MEQGFFPTVGNDGYVASVTGYVLLLILALLVILCVMTNKLRRVSERELALWRLGVWVFPLIAVLLHVVFLNLLPTYVVVSVGVFLAGFGVFSSVCCLLSVWGMQKRLDQGQKNVRFALESVIIIVNFLLLAIMLVPVNSGVSPAAKMLMCQNNLKSLQAAIANYHDKWDHLPNTATGNPPVSWRVQLLSFLEGGELYTPYDAKKPWDDPVNKSLGSQRVSFYNCPARRITVPAGEPWPTAYIIPTGTGALMQPTGKRQFEDATDGLSQTICLVEACGLEIPWTEPRDADISRQPIGVDLKGTGFTDSPGMLSSPHTGLVNVVMADGSSRTVSRNIDPAVLKALLTADGGEEIPADWNWR